MKLYPKLVAVSKTAKNPKETTFTVDYYENVAINEITGNKIKIDSITKNYKILRPLPCTPEEFGRGVETEEEATDANYREYMKQFETNEEHAEETIEDVTNDELANEETTDVEETSPEQNDDDTTNEKTEDDELIETVAKINGVDATDVANAEPKPVKTDDDFEPFPFGIPMTRTVEHKKLGEAEEITFEYGEYTLKVTCDPNSNGVKPVKRGCHVFHNDEEKALIKTTSMKKALETMKIPADEIKRAKKTIELAKHDMDALVK